MAQCSVPTSIVQGRARIWSIGRGLPLEGHQDVAQADLRPPAGRGRARPGGRGWTGSAGPWRAGPGSGAGRARGSPGAVAISWLVTGPCVAVHARYRASPGCRTRPWWRSSSLVPVLRSLAQGPLPARPAGPPAATRSGRAERSAQVAAARGGSRWRARMPGRRPRPRRPPAGRRPRAGPPRARTPSSPSACRKIRAVRLLDPGLLRSRRRRRRSGRARARSSRPGSRWSQLLTTPSRSPCRAQRRQHRRHLRIDLPGLRRAEAVEELGGGERRGRRRLQVLADPLQEPPPPAALALRMGGEAVAPRIGAAGELLPDLADQPRRLLRRRSRRRAAPAPRRRSRPAAAQWIRVWVTSKVTAWIMEEDSCRARGGDSLPCDALPATQTTRAALALPLLRPRLALLFSGLAFGGGGAPAAGGGAGAVPGGRREEALVLSARIYIRPFVARSCAKFNSTPPERSTCFIGGRTRSGRGDTRRSSYVLGCRSLLVRDLWGREIWKASGRIC